MHAPNSNYGYLRLPFKVAKLEIVKTAAVLAKVKHLRSLYRKSSIFLNIKNLSFYKILSEFFNIIGSIIKPFPFCIVFHLKLKQLFKGWVITILVKEIGIIHFFYFFWVDFLFFGHYIYYINYFKIISLYF